MFWISLLIPHDKSDDLILGLEDAYPRWTERYGERRAKWVFRAQAFGIIASFHWSKIAAAAAIVGGWFGFDVVKGWFKAK